MMVPVASPRCAWMLWGSLCERQAVLDATYNTHPGQFRQPPCRATHP